MRLIHRLFLLGYGILRANASHPAIPGRHFGLRDPRRKYSLDRLDPRMHFALVCAARSCPPIAVYDAANIDEQSVGSRLSWGWSRFQDSQKGLELFAAVQAHVQVSLDKGH